MYFVFKRLQQNQLIFHLQDSYLYIHLSNTKIEEKIF